MKNAIKKTKWNIFLLLAAVALLCVGQIEASVALSFMSAVV